MSGPDDPVTVEMDLSVADVHAAGTADVESELPPTHAPADEYEIHHVLRAMGASDAFIEAHRRKNYIE